MRLSTFVDVAAMSTDAAALLGEARAKSQGASVSEACKIWQAAAGRLEELGLLEAEIAARGEAVQLLDQIGDLYGAIEELELIGAAYEGLGRRGDADAVRRQVAARLARMPQAAPGVLADVLRSEADALSGQGKADVQARRSLIDSQAIGALFAPAELSFGMTDDEDVSPPRSISDILGVSQADPEAAVAQDVYFVTRRKLRDKTALVASEDKFGAGAVLVNPYGAFMGRAASTAQYGKARVTLPAGRALGALPRTRLAPLRSSYRHVVVEAAALTAKSDWMKDCRRSVRKTERRELLLFVHGYSTRFSDALARTAQLAVDLQIDGAAMCFAWPSRGHFLGYNADQSEVNDENVALLHELLGQMLQLGAARIHLIAHSMGCRLLTRALDRMAGASPEAADVFDEVVFAAPDVHRDDFAGPAERGARVSKRTTLYASAHDVALVASQIWNGQDVRVGSLRPPPTGEGYESVDATDAPAPAFGHDYFAAGIMDDLQSIIWHSLKPEQRHPILSALTGQKYYQYCPERSSDALAFTYAVNVLRDWERGAAEQMQSFLSSSETGEELRSIALRVMAWVEELSGGEIRRA